MKVRLSSPAFMCLLLIGLISSLPGCGTGYPAVSGTVKIDGELATEGKIAFHPSDGGNETFGSIGSDGSYAMLTNREPGIAPGSYRVTIIAKRRKPSTSVKPENMTADERMEYVPEVGKLIAEIPKKYTEISSTNLTAEVEPGKANEINFDSADFK